MTIEILTFVYGFLYFPSLLYWQQEFILKQTDSDYGTSINYKCYCINVWLILFERDAPHVKKP